MRGLLHVGEEDDVEAEEEVMWLLNVMGERQVENYQSWNTELLGESREIQWNISA